MKPKLYFGIQYIQNDTHNIYNMKHSGGSITVSLYMEMLFFIMEATERFEIAWRFTFQQDKNPTHNQSYTGTGYIKGNMFQCLSPSTVQNSIENVCKDLKTNVCGHLFDIALRKKKKN